ncbi:asparagine synthetase B family protein [Ruminococcus sp.]|uniref:asparagine synthetase B family protein n=1 Tax=Ruminococcus sp. TaxID=41978 RepID=UPI0038677333
MVQVRYYSGYIRNFKKVCEELGITPLSREQREEQILIKGFEKWGTELPEHIFGAFAFALYDDAADKLYVFRDPVGQKQLFYSVAGDELLCSGDIDAIVTDSRIEKRLNMRMLQQYLFYGYPIGEETFYEGVYKLKGGHFLEWDGKNLKKNCYFKPIFRPEDKSIDEFADEIKAVVTEILEEERADTELPYKESFLSGGVDSSYLLAASDAQCANTVGYEEADFSEAHLAQQTAEHFNKGFRVKMITPEAYFERIPTVMDKMGQPLGDASAVAFSIGCQAVKEHADVVYSGEGIDEFFGGYNAHKREIPSDWVYLTCSHIMNTDVVKALMIDFDENVKPSDPLTELWEEAKQEDQLDSKLTMDISFWLDGDIYLNTDRTSTACGIELHTPFSDYRLFEVASRIPSEYQFREEQNKYVFRKAASSILPYESAFRKKVGFPVPVRQWLADERYNQPVKEKLFGRSSQTFFDQEQMKDLWERFVGGESLLWNRVYAIYAFLLWYDLKF